MNDPTAQMGFAMGKNMAAAGQEYVEQNVRSPSRRCIPIQHSRSHSNYGTRVGYNWDESTLTRTVTPRSTNTSTSPP